VPHSIVVLDRDLSIAWLIMLGIRAIPPCSTSPTKQGGVIWSQSVVSHKFLWYGDKLLSLQYRCFSVHQRDQCILDECVRVCSWSPTHVRFGVFVHLSMLHKSSVLLICWFLLEMCIVISTAFSFNNRCQLGDIF
jgi:hypothetical protein